MQKCTFFTKMKKKFKAKFKTNFRQNTNVHFSRVRKKKVRRGRGGGKTSILAFYRLFEWENNSCHFTICLILTFYNSIFNDNVIDKISLFILHTLTWWLDMSVRPICMSVKSFMHHSLAFPWCMTLFRQSKLVALEIYMTDYINWSWNV